MPESEGTLVARRYRLIKVVGAGGMGRVWLGHDELIGREVAIKEILLPPELDDEQRDLLTRRTIREAQAAGRMNHRGIVTVHDVVEHHGAPAIVMEFLRGGSLADAIRARGGLPVEEVAAIGAAMLDALRAAHAMGVVHRDLKPANVLLDGDRVVLTDFGIASLAGAAQLTGTGVIVGTPAFMAPEQAHGELPTPASDLWSLGATLYAAVEGRPPFDGDGFTAVLAGLLTRDPRPPVRAGRLAPLLLALLTKDPARRPTAEPTARLLAAAPSPGGTAPSPGGPAASPGGTAPSPGGPAPSGGPAASPGGPAPSGGPAASPGGPAPSGGPAASPGGTAPAAGPAMRHGQIPTGTPVPPGPDPLAGRHAPAATVPSPQGDPSAGRGGVRRRTVLIAGAGALAVIGIPAAVWVYGSKDPDDVRTPVGTPSPDGTSRRSPADKTPEPAAVVEITDHIQLLGHRKSVTKVAFSPDGKLLASGDGDLTDRPKTRLWDPASGKLVATLLGPTATGGGSADAVAFSPDGRLLASGGNFLGDSTRLWNVADRRLIGPFPQSGSIMKSLAFSPDGTLLAGVTHGGTTTLWDVPSRRVRIGLPDSDGFRNVTFSPDGKLLAGGGKGGDIRLSDPATGRTIRTIDDATGSEVAFSPDGKTLAAPDTDAGDHSLQLWDLATGRSTARFDWVDDMVTSVVFSPDGRTLATWSLGNLIHLWDVATGRVRATLIGHSAPIHTAAFSPDGKKLASAGQDTTIRIWTLTA
ncbi:WD40 repeat domain-containing serine/threonine protein kinase [Sphaerisporangium corydalis]|uniref:WD40 repeat domain-containing serine/threonine protein kinase n=1 Tax=Sphaerisporangium corydalis TaxID=1441875 RepID=A0ABV9E773_9ACTN|nr:serine/threonine-protein kinase [Sphaerisporangium corydalis]